MNQQDLRIHLIVIQMLACATVCVGQLQPSTMRSAAPTTQAIADTIKATTDELNDGDPAVVMHGVRQIDALLQANPQRVMGMVRGVWLKRLMEIRHYDDVLDVSLRAVLASPADTLAIEQLFTFRVQGFLAEGKAPQALATAKQLFAVCSLKGTEDAIRAVCQCLDAVHPDDREILRRYREEQVEGANPVPPVAPRQVLVLSDVPVDVAPYDQAIRTIAAEDYRSLTGQGNLMLLAGDPADAWNIFEQAYTLAADRELPAASESLARCMRAQDGTIGRANAWVLSIRPKSSAASERTPLSAFAATPSKQKE